MKVSFKFSDKDIVEVEAFDQLNLLAHGQLCERSLQSRCGGQCECGTCRVRLVAGRLSPMCPGELELLKAVGAPTDGSVRLACQSFPASDEVAIEVPTEVFKDARGRRKLKA